MRKCVVTNDAPETVRHDHVRRERVDSFDQTFAQRRVQRCVLVPLRHHACVPAVGRLGDWSGPIKQPAPWTKPAGHRLSRVFDGRSERREAEMRRRPYVGEEINLAREQIVVIEALVGRRNIMIEILDAGGDCFFPWAVPTADCPDAPGGRLREPGGFSSDQTVNGFCSSNGCWPVRS